MKSNALIKRGLQNRITLNKINELTLSINHLKSSQSLKESNDTKNVVNVIIQFLKN